MPIWIIRFLKKYWKVVLVVAAVGLAYLYLKRYDDGWASRYEELKASHEQQMVEIEAARSEERLRHEQNVKQLRAEIQDVRRTYDEQIRQLESRRRSIAKKIVEEHGDDPVALAHQLSEVTGFRVQEVVRP